IRSVPSPNRSEKPEPTGWPDGSSTKGCFVFQNGVMIVPDPEVATPPFSLIVPSKVMPAPVSKVKWMVVACAPPDVSANPAAAAASNTFIIVCNQFLSVRKNVRVIGNQAESASPK